MNDERRMSGVSTNVRPFFNHPAWAPALRMADFCSTSIIRPMVPWQTVIVRYRTAGIPSGVREASAAIHFTFAVRADRKNRGVIKNSSSTLQK